MDQKFSFFKSIDFYIHDKQIIVYPDKDAIESYKGFSYKDLESYLKELVDRDSEYFKDMHYAITFIWNFENDKMIDFWKFNGNFVDDRSGPLADVRIYRNQKIANELGIASGNTLLVLGIEEELRRKSSDLNSYLTGPAPKLPFELLVDKDFF